LPPVEKAGFLAQINGFLCPFVLENSLIFGLKPKAMALFSR
jgi:hypothetical protein